MPLARSTFATAAASTASSKSIVPTTCERSAGSATNGVAYARLSRPSRRGVADESAVRSVAPGEAALGVDPVDLLGQQEQGRERRGVVRLVQAAVVDRGLQVEERRDPAAGGLDLPRRARARPGTSARATGRRRRRSTSAGRSSRRRSAPTSTGSPPAPDVASTSSSAPSSAPATRRTGDRDTGRGLVVRARVDVDAGLGDQRRARRPGRRVIDRRRRRGTARPRRRRRTCAPNSPNVRSCAAVADQAERRRRPRTRSSRRCRARPRSRRAGEQLGAGPRAPGPPGPSPVFCRCEVPR